MKFYSLKIQHFSYPTSEAIQVTFKIPEELKNEYNYRAGQYLTLKVYKNNQEYRRDYSIVTAPYEGVLSVVIKKVKNGEISSYLYDNIPTMESIEISTPAGTFGLSEKPNEKRTLLFFATGSGITPIISMIKQVLHTEKGSFLYLFYGNKTQQTTLFYEELNQLKIKYPTFHPYFLFTGQKTEALFQGRIDARKLDLFINQILEWDEVDEILICGKEKMTRTITQAAFERGIPRKNIRFELFSAPKEPIFKENTSLKPEITAVEVVFTSEGKTHRLQWATEEVSLLDAMLDQGYNVPYSCKGGVCSSCMCRLLAGDIGVSENLILTEADLEKKLRLVCVATPITEKVTLTFDL